MAEKLDLSHYNGQMTVVGYPDLPWKPNAVTSKTVFHASLENTNQKPRRQPKK